MKFRLSVISIICISLVAIAYQNCGESTKGDGTNHTVSVLCHPTGNCLKFRLTTYEKMDCDAGKNKARIDTMTVQNAAVMSSVTWDNCDQKDATSACCEQGDVAAHFQTSDGSKDVSVFFNNDVDYQYDYSQ
jgi:hypothetical protein